MSPVECLLKAQNYEVAAKLDPLGENAGTWLDLAAAWKMLAVENRGGRAVSGVAFIRPQDEVDLWNALASEQPKGPSSLY